MKITEVTIKKADNAKRLLAFASIVIDDCLVIRDIRIIKGMHGKFIAMPSRKITVRCQNCKLKVAILDNYCPHCGTENTNDSDQDKVYADVVHPITTDFRIYIQNTIIGVHDKCLDTLPQSLEYCTRVD